MRSLAALVVTVLGVSAAGAAPQAEPKKTPEFKGEMKQMIAFLKCDEAQQRLVAEVLERHAGAREALDASHAQQRKQIEAEKQEARRQLQQIEDKDKAKALRDRISQLDAAVRKMAQRRRDMEAVHAAEFATLFTPAQLFSWQKHKMAVSALGRYRSLGLDKEQTAQIEALAEQAVMEINKTEVKDESERRRAAAKIEEKLHKTIYDEVLTEENRLSADTERMCREVLGGFRKLKLTQDQRRRVRDLCRPRAEALRKLSADQTRQAWLETVDEIRKAARESVLDDEQKAKLKTDAKGDKPARASQRRG